MISPGEDLQARRALRKRPRDRWAPRSLPETLVLALLYAIFLVVLLIVALGSYNVIWLRQQTRSGPELRPGMFPLSDYEEQTIFRVGNVSNRAERPSHFLNFAPGKPGGAIRIGAFGDSHTWGSEVVGAHDFPAHLQRLFDKRTEKVEVLNFGVPGFGFQQSFLLWEEFAPRYHLDFILLGPRCFQPERDLTFQPRLANPFTIKGRFILDGEGVRFVAARGTTLKDRYRHYQALLPPLDYVRYDRHAPAAWQRLVPLLRNRPNPFYYVSLGEDVEASSINVQLLRRLTSESDAQVIFFHEEQSRLEEYRPLHDLINLNSPMRLRTGFPYWRHGHSSSFGNELVARVFFSILTGQEDAHFQVFRFSPLKNANHGFPRGAPSLAQTQSMSLTLEGKTIATLQAAAHEADAEGYFGKSWDSSVASLLIVKNSSMSISEGKVFGLSFEINEGTTLELALGDGGRYALSQVSLVSESPRIGYVDLSFVKHRFSSKLQGQAVYLGWDAALRELRSRGALREEAGRDNNRLRLYLGGHLVMERTLSDAERRGFVEVNFEGSSPKWAFRAVNDVFMDPQEIAGSGTVFLVLRDGTGREHSLALEEWRQETQTVPLARRGLGRSIVLGHDGSASVEARDGGSS